MSVLSGKVRLKIDLRKTLAKYDVFLDSRTSMRRSLSWFAVLVGLVVACGDRNADRPKRVVEARTPTLPNDYVLHPSSSDLRAPDHALVALETTRGRILVALDRSLSPYAADRFYTLVVARFFDGTQIGSADAQAVIFAKHPSLDVQNVWYMRRLVPEEETHPNERGTITMLGAGHAGRSTDVAINLAHVAAHDASHATPFGRLRDLDVASRLRSGDVVRSARVVEEAP